MTREAIKEMITRFFKTPYREISTGWVMTECPFAEWTHPDGDDKNYSFGISVKNGYHCFTCGKHGHVLNLTRDIARYSHFYDFSLAEFIEANYEEEDYFSDKVNIEEIITIDFGFLDELPYAVGKLHFDLKDCKKWNLRYDAVRNAVYFPYYNAEKKPVKLKVRLLSKKVFFFLNEGEREKSYYGEWFTPKKWLILVEGERDAIFTSRYVTTWATGGFPTKKMIEKLIKLKKKLVLFFDNDDTGKKIKLFFVKYLAGLVNLYEVREYFGCKDPAEMYEKGFLEKVFKHIKKL